MMTEQRSIAGRVQYRASIDRPKDSFGDEWQIFKMLAQRGKINSDAG
jgi:hypothetical protein